MIHMQYVRRSKQKRSWLTSKYKIDLVHPLSGLFGATGSELEGERQ